MQQEFIDILRAAKDPAELAFAHGVEHAIEMENVLREEILKGEGEEDGEGTTGD